MFLSFPLVIYHLGKLVGSLRIFGRSIVGRHGNHGAQVEVFLDFSWVTMIYQLPTAVTVGLSLGLGSGAPLLVGLDDRNGSLEAWNSTVVLQSANL